MNVSGNYLGSILLERNRWKGGEKRVPSIDLAALSAHIIAAGFDGLELWDVHYLAGEEAQRAFLRSGALPVRIYNSYWIPEPENEIAAADALRAVHELKDTLSGIKFNFGRPGSDLSAQIEVLKTWAGELPPGIKLLCECHPGTVVEHPEAAAGMLQEFSPERLDIIIHPVSGTFDLLQEWFDHCGPRIKHLHLQAREPVNNAWAHIAHDPQRLAAAVATCRRNGFSGSATFEFTRGTGTPEDVPETMLEHAITDLRDWLEAIRQS